MDNEDKDSSQKTEQPTERRIREARNKGNIPVSKELNTFIFFVVFTILISYFIPNIVSKSLYKLIGYISNPHNIIVSKSTIFDIAKELMFILFSIILLPIVVVMLCSFLSNISQNGILFAPEAVKLDLKRISIIAGLKRILSLNAILEMSKGLLKIIVVGIIIYLSLGKHISQISLLHTLDISQSMLFLHKFLSEMFIAISIIMMFIGGFDLLYQRKRYINNLMMTKEEVKKEYKETEGDPKIKSKLRRLREKLMKSRMMSQVPKADVVITNPTHYAIALKYDEKNDLAVPIVTAKGVDEIALTIRKIAKEHKIPIFEDPPLAQSLYKAVDLNEEIPLEFYKAVAKIIAKVLKMKRK